MYWGRNRETMSVLLYNLVLALVVTGVVAGTVLYFKSRQSDIWQLWYTTLLLAGSLYVIYAGQRGIREKTLGNEKVCYSVAQSIVLGIYHVFCMYIMLAGSSLILMRIIYRHFRFLF